MVSASVVADAKESLRIARGARTPESRQLAVRNPSAPVHTQIPTQIPMMKHDGASSRTLSVCLTPRTCSGCARFERASCSNGCAPSSDWRRAAAGGWLKRQGTLWTTSRPTTKPTLKMQVRALLRCTGGCLHRQPRSAGQEALRRWAARDPRRRCGAEAQGFCSRPSRRWLCVDTPPYVYSAYLTGTGSLCT